MLNSKLQRIKELIQENEKIDTELAQLIASPTSRNVADGKRRDKMRAISPKLSRRRASELVA